LQFNVVVGDGSVLKRNEPCRGVDVSLGAPPSSE
jgi:hypothetical protein